MTALLYQLVYGFFLLLLLIPGRSLLKELMPRQQWPNYPIQSSGKGLAIAFGLGLLYGAFSLSTVLIVLHLRTPAPASPAQDPVIAKFITCVAQPLVETLILLGVAARNDERSDAQSRSVFRRRLAETEVGIWRTVFETGRTVGETDARSSVPTRGV